MNKVSIEDAATVIKAISDHLNEGGSFRYLIYDRLGFLPDDYEELFRAGGLHVSNAANEMIDLRVALSSFIRSVERGNPEELKKTVDSFVRYVKAYSYVENVSYNIE